LPSGVNTDACQADFENGVLTLKLPKAEEAKVKRVQIASKSDNGK
jgi:HSP20 family molecular chaperone IbpA